MYTFQDQTQEYYQYKQNYYYTPEYTQTIHNISVFTPTDKQNYEQIDSEYFIQLSKQKHHQNNQINQNTPKTDEKKPNNRRYRQNELRRKITKMEIDLETLKIKHANCTDAFQADFLMKHIKELTSTIKQKKRHLLRLEKNMTAQEAIRNKKSHSSQ